MESYLPELPEVETIRRSLRSKLIGQTITSVQLHLPKIVKMPSPEAFIETIAGKEIQDLDRRGKYLLVRLNDGLVLVFHLRMTGQLLYCPAADPMAKHTHAIFELPNGYHLRFVDMRQFGTLYLVKEEDFALIKGLWTLGPEPLGADFTPESFRKSISKRKGNLKQVLLNQSFVAGIGNIYADEILFASGLHPERPAHTLSEEEQERLYHSIRKVIQAAIDHRGTSFRNYVDGQGVAGGHQLYLQVYRKTGKPCQSCGEYIQRKRVAGRSSHFCPRCQK